MFAQPMSSPMMKMMLGRCCCCADAVPATVWAMDMCPVPHCMSGQPHYRDRLGESISINSKCLADLESPSSTIPQWELRLRELGSPQGA